MNSFSHTLALGNANLTRRLILSPFYQRLWGSRFTFRDDQNTKVQVDNSEGGSRLATSVGGTLLGTGGDVLVVRQWRRGDRLLPVSWPSPVSQLQ
jgi:hypothetical protein